MTYQQNIVELTVKIVEWLECKLYTHFQNQWMHSHAVRMVWELQGIVLYKNIIF